MSAELIEADGEKVGPTPEQGLSSERAHELTQRLERAGSVALESVAVTKQKRAAVPPYCTSTLQQDAARLLGFSAKRTMGAAQQLFEGAPWPCAQCSPTIACAVQAWTLLNRCLRSIAPDKRTHATLSSLATYCLQRA